MSTIKIIDTGTQFGYKTSEIFMSWPVEIYETLGDGDFEETMDAINPDLILFGGGADIDPELYNHKNKASWNTIQSFYRDQQECFMWRKAKEKDIPTLGICRGAQFTCAMSGGTLIQDVRNHGVTHSILTRDNRVLDMTSTHHQMMYPWNTKHELIAWAPRRSSRYVYAGSDFDESLMEREPEIVFFPDTKALAVQGHPEYFNSDDHPTVVYVRTLVKDLLLKRKFI